MVCLGLEPGAAVWNVQTNPMSYVWQHPWLPLFYHKLIEHKAGENLQKYKRNYLTVYLLPSRKYTWQAVRQATPLTKELLVGRASHGREFLFHSKTLTYLDTGKRKISQRWVCPPKHSPSFSLKDINVMFTWEVTAAASSSSVTDYNPVGCILSEEIFLVF